MVALSSSLASRSSRSASYKPTTNSLTEPTTERRSLFATSRASRRRRTKRTRNQSLPSINGFSNWILFPSFLFFLSIQETFVRAFLTKLRPGFFGGKAFSQALVFSNLCKVFSQQEQPTNTKSPRKKAKEQGHQEQARRSKKRRRE